MPQLDFSTYLGQIFWLFVSFTSLYLFVQYWFFPRIKSILQIRDAKIESLILEAQNLRDKSEQLEKSYLTELSDFHSKLKQISHGTEVFCKNYSDSSIESLEKSLLKQKKQLEKVLEKWRSDVSGDMEDISVSLSQNLLASILGGGASAEKEIRKVDLVKYYNKIKDE